MTQPRTVIALLIFFALGTLTGSSVQGAEATTTVSVTTAADALTLHPAFPFEGELSRMMLRVSGPAGVEELAFAAGEAVIFETAGHPDGAYTWELTAIPAVDEETRAALAAARESAEGPAVAARRAGATPAGALRAHGYFTLAGGAPVAAGGGQEAQGASPETAGRASGASAVGPRNVTAEDQIILDDLIVIGSECVGDSCINNEDFGSDTLRLKEVNTRLRFQDTSTGAYPSNDWLLTANESTSGGANKFSIDDVDGGTTPFTLEAGAPDNALYVDDAGRVGFGTAAPVAELHPVSGDTPTLRLEQDGSSSFTPQIWEVAGNEANFFIEDTTHAAKMPLRIRPDAPTNSLMIAADGNIGLGTASPAADLHILGGAESDLRFSTTSRSWLFQVNSFDTFSIRDDSGGSTPFKLFAGAPADMLVIKNVGGQGRVGINTTNPAGTLDVNGSIYQRGGVRHADYVFEPGYELESIEEHAAYMWTHKHLPAVGKGRVDEQGREVVELGDRQRGVLEELEKAHIYIEQLNEAVRARDALIAELMERLERVEETLDR